jgi:hypothetical protein
MIVRLITISLLLLSIIAIGQPGDPGGGGTPGAVPIGGIEILIALGAALGIKNIFLKRRKESQ